MSSSQAGVSTEKPCARVAFYDIYKTIGRGNFAVVKLAKHRFTKSEVAIKIIDKRVLEESNLEKIYREVKILKSLDHENIIKLYQVMESENMLYIVSEYAPNGEIFDYIAKHGKMTEPEARLKFWQIIRAVDYCHQLGIVHRDLKTENLLLDVDMKIKIADFGFGNFYRPGVELSTWCGSPPYAAPEVFEGRKYCGTEIDIWSLGVILYILVCGALPFDAQNLPALRDRVVSGRFRIPFFMSSDCENLVRRMLVVDPNRRATMDQIKCHVWMTHHTNTGSNSPAETITPGTVSPSDTVVSISPPTGSPTRSVTVANSLGRKPTQTVTVGGEQGVGGEVVYNEKILRIMQEQGIDIPKTVQALRSKTYDHLAAIYYLLVDKLRHQMELLASKRLVLESACRRPSTIADQAALCVGGTNRPPSLADTRTGVFSQTTDCVSVAEPAGAVCQVQQRIYTSEQGPAPQRTCPAKLGPSTRMPLSAGAGGRILTASIDEGVEFESACSSERGSSSSNGSAVGASEAEGLAARLGMSQRGGGSLAAAPLADVDLDSNLSSSFGSIVSSTGDETETSSVQFPLRQTGEDDAGAEGGSTQQQEEFCEGRRASDGLMAHGIGAFQSQFKTVTKSKGIAELRRELERLRLETCGESTTSRCSSTAHRKLRHIGQSASLADEAVAAMMASPQRNCIIKRKAVQSTNVTHQNRLAAPELGCYPRDGDADQCQRAAVASTLLHQPRCRTNRAINVPVHFQQLLLDGGVPRHPTQRPISPLVAPDMRPPLRIAYATQSRDSSPCHVLQTVTPSGYAVMPVCRPDWSRAGGAVVPTCQSHDSLVRVEHTPAAEQTTLSDHVTFSQQATSETRTHGSDWSSNDQSKRHMVRRTLFRLVQQQTLASCEDDDDFVESSEQKGEAEKESDPSKRQSSHLDAMDFS